MTDIKISQLNNVSSLETTDLFEISRSTGAATFESKSIDYHDLLHSISGGRVVTVGATGAMATTIEEGIEHAQEFNPTAANPVNIRVSPGTYTENPLVVPAYVSISGIGGSKGVIVTAIDPDAVLFTLSFNAKLGGLSIRGATGATGVGVKASTGVFDSVLEDCAVRDCTVGVWADGAASVIRMQNVTFLTFSIAADAGFKTTDGGQQASTNTIMRTAATGTIETGVLCTGTDSRIDLTGYRIDSCTNGIYADDCATVHSSTGSIERCTNALRIGATGADSFIEAYATSILNSDTYDVLIESVTGDIDFTGKMTYSKRSIVAGALLESIGVDDEDEIMHITGQLHIEEKTDIGVPGGEDLGLDIGLDVGEGGSYVDDKDGNEIVEYWQYDASAASGSRFTRCVGNDGTQLTDEGDAIVVGSLYSWSAVRLAITTAANVGSNSIVTEHWNGSSWTEDMVAVYRKLDLLHRQSVLFQNVETQYVELGTAVNDDWVSDRNVTDEIPNWELGTDLYPVRFRNNGGSLTTGMVFQDGRVRGDDFDISESRQTVNWGRNRQENPQSIAVNGLIANAVNPPDDVTIETSPNISNILPAGFVDGDVCASSLAVTVPDWADTSSGVTLRIGYYTTNALAGNVNWTIRYLPIVAGTTVFDGANTEYVASVISTVPGVTELSWLAQYSFDISSFPPSTNFMVSIERDATAGNPLDTYAGDAIIYGVTMVWTRKRIA